MPQDLFRVVAARPSLVRSRRSPLVLLSLAAHGVVVLGGIVATIAAPDALPFPRVALAYHSPMPVRLVDIDLPVPPPNRKPLARSAHDTAIVAAPIPQPVSPTAPRDAPSGIAPETGNEPSPTSHDGGASPDDANGPVVARPAGVAQRAEPSPAVTTPVRLHTGVTPPQKVVDVAPAYPPIARTAHVQGLVVLEATIDTEGRVTDLRVLRSVPLLDDAALQAVRQWRFTPGQLNGQAVAIIMTVTVRFALDR